MEIDKTVRLLRYSYNRRLSFLYAIARNQKRIILKNVKLIYYLVTKIILKQGLLSPSTKKSFLIAYLLVTIPRLIKKLISLILNRKYRDIVPTTSKILTKSLQFHTFPMFVVKLISILNLSNFILKSKVRNKLVLNLISSFIAAIVTFPGYQRYIIEKQNDRYYTLDLTLTLVVRAVDTLIFSPYFNGVGDAFLFIASSYFIMESWFLYPNKLIPSYREWITSAANMDEEMIKGFRYMNTNEIQYLHKSEDDDTTSDKTLPSEQDYFERFCTKYDKDPKLGDLIHQDKLPCEVIHCFSFKSCELHALYRFWRQFKFAVKLYGSINVVFWLLLRRKKLSKYIVSTIRSSLFLATFSSLDWYGLCLTRKDWLAKLFPNVPQRTWDLLAPKVGAFLSGFSCFVESPGRRKELSLFVAPKALGTFISPKVTERNLMIETLAFSMSFAVLVAFAKHRPGRVRGLVGSALSIVFN
ncbi:hypothetical protein DFJ63DRAFT_17526 [Scheffersomyces coipomensis]|uniref:uncharacterized protein n=1 Tax=Scheffersomyces coipomensis TaxID=1788519 RepID=UPI00315D110E